MLPSKQDYNNVRTANAAQTVAAFMNRVYLWMMVGITISGLTAYTVAARPDIIIYIMQNRIIFY